MIGFYESGVCSGLAYGLFLVAFVTHMARKLKLPVRRALPLGLGVLVVAWLPMQPHLVGILRGAFGELSVATLMASLLLLLTACGKYEAREDVSLKCCKWVVIVVGALLYGNYLGYIAPGHFSLYEAGFSSGWLPLCLGGLGVLAALRGWVLPAWWMGLSLGGWLLRILPTDNLWDYVFDAPLWLVACCSVLLMWLTGLKKAGTLLRQ